MWRTEAWERTGAAFGLRERRRVWAALAAVWCLAIRGVSALVITEIMYHPADTNRVPEFVEIYNDHPEPEDLTGYAFTEGIQFTFAPGQLLRGGGLLVVAKEPDLLRTRHGLDNVVGPFAGQLDNAGETLALAIENGGRLLRFAYDDEGRWPVAADGAGHSLVLRGPWLDPGEPESWEASAAMGGSPGLYEYDIYPPPVYDYATLVEEGAAARLLPGRQEASSPPSSWTARVFDDSAWAAGATPIGYGDPRVATSVAEMPDAYVSVYARIPFDVTAAQRAAAGTLRLEILSDDGFVAYINGAEVARARMGAAGMPIPHDTAAAGSVESAVGESFDITKHVGLLASGANALSLQGHNAALAGDPDFLLSARLILGTVVPDTDGRVVPPRAPVPLVVNEFLANSSGDDWIELHNRGAVALHLDGHYLSDSRTDLLKYRVPPLTVIERGGFWTVSQAEFGFGLNSEVGEQIFVSRVGASTVVVDAVQFGPEPFEDVSLGRYPDGGDTWHRMLEATPGFGNRVKLEDSVIINEVMYHTIDERDDLEYVELYNRGSAAVPLAGWSLTKAVDYTFSVGDGGSIRPGEYLVIAAEPAALVSRYGAMSVRGPWRGRLADGGEKIRLRDRLGNIVDEVAYRGGGRWPRWADGWGASLELIDPRDANDTGDAWAEGGPIQPAPWIAFECSGEFSDGEGELHLLLVNQGECLVDGLEIVEQGSGSNLLANGSFEQGAGGWKIEGNHIQSFVTGEDAHDGNRSLHLTATGSGDTGANRIERDVTLVSGRRYTIRGWARWLRGCPFLVVRTHGNSIACTVEMRVPQRIGTPGAANSARVANRGPGIAEVAHAPVVPGAADPVTVTARVRDVDGVTAVSIQCRVNGMGAWSAAPMNDDGIGPDAVAGDGTYTGQIPPHANGQVVAFHVRAVDGQGAAATFPARPDRSECLYLVQNGYAPGLFPTYQIVMAQPALNALSSRPKMSNELLDATFIFEGHEVYYNVGARYRGSPFIRPNPPSNPLGGTLGWRVTFNDDQLFRGRLHLNLDHNEPSRDSTRQRDRTSHWIARKIGLQYSPESYVRLRINTSDRGPYSDRWKPDRDYLSLWFPGEDGPLHKVDDWFEFNDSGGFQNRDARVTYLGAQKERYRWSWQKLNQERDDDYAPLIQLMARANQGTGKEWEAGLESAMDVEQWLREIAVRHAVGDWDSLGYNRGKNNFIYRRASDGRFVLLPWDIDFSLGTGSSATASVYDTIDGTLRQVMQYPKYNRMYLRAFQDMVEGPLRSEVMSPMVSDMHTLLISDFGRQITDPAAIVSWAAARRTYLAGLLPTGAALAITTNGGARFTTQDPAARIEGTAPLAAVGFELNGAAVDLVWAGATQWSLPLELAPGRNPYELEAFDARGLLIGRDSIDITLELSALRDADRDGLSDLDEWQTHGTDYRLADTDGDGLSDGEEVLEYGTDPLDPRSTPHALTGIERGPQGVTITWQSVPGRAYRILYSGDLEHWTEAALAEPVRGDGGVIEWTDTGPPLTEPHPLGHAVGQRYYWIRMEEGGFVPSGPNGLTVTYYQGMNFETALVTRIDPVVDFNWGYFGRPAEQVPLNRFSARWTGHIWIETPGAYTFYTVSDDGVRLWIDDELAYSDWTDHGAREGNVTLDLARGGYPIRLEYYENSGSAVIRLLWSGPGIAKQVIPAAVLFAQQR